MPIWKQKLLARYQYRDALNENGGESGGSGSHGSSDSSSNDGADDSDESSDDGSKKTGDEAAGSGEKKPTDEEARLLKESMKRKEEVKRLRERLSSLEGLETTLNELGGLDALKGLVQTQRDNETKSLEAKGDWERLRTRMAEEHSRAMETSNAKLAEALAESQRLQGQLVEVTIGAEFSNSEFIRSDLLMPASKARKLYGAHFEFEDGRIVGYDKPRGEANRTPYVNSQGEPLNFDSAFKEIIDNDPDKETLLRDKGKSGAESGTQRTVRREEKRPMTGQERIAAALSKTSLFKTQ